MNAITLHQPWASLMAAQLKCIETRDWMPPSRCVFPAHGASRRRETVETLPPHAHAGS